MSHLGQNIKYIEHSHMLYFWTANKLNFNIMFTEQKYSSSFKSYAQLNLVLTFSFFTTTAEELLECFQNDFFPGTMHLLVSHAAAKVEVFNHSSDISQW